MLQPRQPTDPSVKDATKDAILQAAIEEFAAHGSDGATTRAISARAGVTHGLVRYYFGTKEKLWFAAADFLFDRHAREVPVTPEIIERMWNGDLDTCRDWLRSYIYYCARHPEDARIIYQEIMLQSDRLKYIVDRYIRNDQIIFLEMIKRLIELGVIPKTARPVSVMYIIVACSQNIFAMAEEIKLSIGYDPRTPEAIEAHATTVVDLLIPPSA